MTWNIPCCWTTGGSCHGDSPVLFNNHPALTQTCRRSSAALQKMSDCGGGWDRPTCRVWILPVSSAAALHRWISQKRSMHRHIYESYCHSNRFTGFYSYIYRERSCFYFAVSLFMIEVFFLMVLNSFSTSSVMWRSILNLWWSLSFAF